jgi:quercetin dioxygenase-like cupin family protein
MTVFHRAGSRTTKQADAANFTGIVLADEVVASKLPLHLRCTRVSFTPGARTAWHTHPMGQVLYVLSGIGRYQEVGQKPVILQPGDTVVIPPGVKHWHGADAAHLFVHLAMLESDAAGETANWMEHVTDAEFAAEAMLPG